MCWINTIGHDEVSSGRQLEAITAHKWRNWPPSPPSRVDYLKSPIPCCASTIRGSVKWIKQILPCYFYNCWTFILYAGWSYFGSDADTKYTCYSTVTKYKNKKACRKHRHAAAIGVAMHRKNVIISLRTSQLSKVCLSLERAKHSMFLSSINIKKSDRMKNRGVVLFGGGVI